MHGHAEPFNSVFLSERNLKCMRTFLLIEKLEKWILKEPTKKTYIKPLPCLYSAVIKKKQAYKNV